MDLSDFKVFLMEKERSSETIESYLWTVNTYFKTYGEINKLSLLEFKNKLINENSPATAAQRCFAMNAYCEFIGKPELKLKGVRVHNTTGVENVITEEEYKHFLNCLLKDGNIKTYWLLRYLAGTGARVSEILKMKKSDLDIGMCTIWTKGKIRTIYIPKTLIDESREYFNSTEGELLFPNRYGKPMGRTGVHRQIEKYGLRYGIRKEVLHPHAFRHFFAIEFLKQNNNLTLLSSLLGHESVTTTSIYLRQSTKQQMEELNKAYEKFAQNI